MIKVWFRVSNWQCKVGYIIDGFYDGLLQVQEEETGKIFICAENELETINS